MADTATQPRPTDRESRVREWIRALSEMPARFAGTSLERAAAERVGAWMRELGAREVELAPAPNAPRTGFVLALHGAVGLLGVMRGGFGGAVLAVLALWSFRSEFRRRRPRLSRLLPAAESVNVIGRFGTPGAPRRVVVSAHVDSAQAGWIFSKAMADRFAGTAMRLRRGGGPPPGPLAMPEAILVASALVAIGGWLGAYGFVFETLRWVAGLGCLVVIGTTLQWALSPPTPGANDNASGVAAMLVCGERLRDRLPADVELLLVGTGAEEVGCRGMHGFVEQHGDWPLDGTYFLNFDSVGGGHLHYVATEGVLQKTVFPPPLNELARRVAAGGAFGEATATELLAATDGHAPAARGYSTLSLIALEANGVPRNYHRREDTVDGVDLAVVVRAGDFAAAVATAALRGDAGPIS